MSPLLFQLATAGAKKAMSLVLTTEFLKRASITTLSMY